MLLLNVDATGGGSVHIELLDCAADAPTAEAAHVLASSVPVNGDALNKTVAWVKHTTVVYTDIGVLAGRPLCMRFSLVGADVFAFQFIKTDDDFQETAVVNSSPPTHPPWSCADLVRGPVAWTWSKPGGAIDEWSHPISDASVNFSFWGTHSGRADAVGNITMTPASETGGNGSLLFIGAKSSNGAPCCSVTMNPDCTRLDFDNGGQYWRVQPPAGSPPPPPLPPAPSCNITAYWRQSFPVIQQPLRHPVYAYSHWLVVRPGVPRRRDVRRHVGDGDRTLEAGQRHGEPRLQHDHLGPDGLEQSDDPPDPTDAGATSTSTTTRTLFRRHGLLAAWHLHGWDLQV